MPEQNNDLNSSDLEFEQALRSIHPAIAHLSPIDASFLAGRRSARFQLHLWQSTAAIILFLGIGSHLLPSKPATLPTSFTPAIYSNPDLSPLVQPLSVHSVLMLEQAVQKNGLAGLSPTSLPDSHNFHSKSTL
ncbi:MAG TPA: hypothetical protein VFE58_08245 [Tepidisphaeraceae bacterium]|jgi:hypothetical protein|nr:hypothetical protein [Tepidisphaeraceae bacterium]